MKNNSTFNMMKTQAQEKLMDFKAIMLDIPEQSKLLKVNTLMLEMYVKLQVNLNELLDYQNIESNPLQ